jgi:hypothetical protein
MVVMALHGKLAAEIMGKILQLLEKLQLAVGRVGVGALLPTMVKLVGQVEVLLAKMGLRAVLGINLTQRHTMELDMVMMVVMGT